jgi:Zn-dependent alcohol dehydrogenase
MHPYSSSSVEPWDRRTLLQRSSAALAGSAWWVGSPRGHGSAPADRKLKIALVGCGGRGTGAAIQALSTAGETELVAMADAFPERLESSLQEIARERGARTNVPRERRFVGFDAYRQAMEVDGVDVVLLTTPPGFRPAHFEHAVALGKHPACGACSRPPRRPAPRD